MIFIFTCKSKRSKKEEMEEAQMHIDNLGQQYEPLSDTSSSKRNSVDAPSNNKKQTSSGNGTLNADLERTRAKSNPLPATPSNPALAATPSSTSHNNNNSNNHRKSLQQPNHMITVPVPVMSDKEKKKLYSGKLRTVRSIADGGFSRVYEVEGLEGSPLVGRMAMKELILASEHVNSVRRDKIQPSVSKRINDEISMFKKLSVHENVVKYLDSYVDEETNTVYILQELCDMNLKNCLQSQIGKISDKMILDWCRTLARVLEYVHSEGIIHRDIKPANILFKKQKVDEQFRLVLKLCDFGLSKNTERSDAKTAVGSPSFIAPEVKLKSGTYGNKCDIWSFAVLVYQLIGKIADEFNIPDFERILMERPQAVENSKHLKAVLNDSTHPLHNLAVICVNSLKLDPNERPSAAEIVKAIC